MALLQSDHALELLRGIVDRSSADQTEVTLESVEDSFVRYASSGPTQNADRERHQLSIRVRLSAGVRISPRAFFFCGLFNVMTATRDSIRQSNSSVPVSNSIIEFC